MLNKILWMSVLSGFLVATGAQAQTAEVVNPPSKNTLKKKAKKAKTKPVAKTVAKTKFIDGSQETKKERDTRLTRECKGEVNAGACSGYTR